MHSTQIENVVILHNGDYSGDITINKYASSDFDSLPLEQISLPFSVLAGFVAQYVVSEKISKLEQMKTAEILGVDSIE